MCVVRVLSLPSLSSLLLPIPSLPFSLSASHLDQGVQLLVTTDGELQVAGRDALDLRWSC